MRIITQIVKAGKGRYRIFTEDREAFLLYRADIAKYDLEVGKEIEDDFEDRLCLEVLNERAKNRLLYLLQAKDYTSKEMEEKLRTALYPERSIDYAIGQMKYYGYIDDERYAHRYCEYFLERKSICEIRRTLLKKGVNREVVSTTIEEIKEEKGYSEENESQMIRSLLEKRHYDPDTADEKEKRRQIAFLMRRGFSYSEIRRGLG